MLLELRALGYFGFDTSPIKRNNHLLSSLILDEIVTRLPLLQPVDYEPPFFRGCSEQEAYNPWNKNPLKMEVGNVNSKHFVLTLKVRIKYS